MKDNDLQTGYNFPIKTILITSVLVIGGSLFFLLNRQPGSKNVNSENKELKKEIVKSAIDKAKSFAIKANNYSFQNQEIKIKKGEKVKLFLINEEGSHNLVIDGYNVRSNTVNEKQVTGIEFVANKIGTFEYHCGINGHKEKGMVGELTVK